MFEARETGSFEDLALAGGDEGLEGTRVFFEG
jgi:hypothetical protein